MSFPPKITLCVGAVVRRENKVLFVRQTYGGLKGKWSLPWGFVDDDADSRTPDTPDAAALRETQEEAGVTAELEGLIGVQNHANPEGEPRVYLIFLCRHAAGEPTPDGHETDQAAYFSLEDMDRFGEPFDDFCEWVARRVLNGEYHVIPPAPTNPYRPHLAFF